MWNMPKNANKELTQLRLATKFSWKIMYVKYYTNVRPATNSKKY